MLLHIQTDPTAAIFISEGAASRAAHLVLAKYPTRVSEAVPRKRMSRGETLGYGVMVHFTDKRPSSWLTNSDFERLSWTYPKDEK